MNESSSILNNRQENMNARWQFGDNHTLFNDDDADYYYDMDYGYLDFGNILKEDQKDLLIYYKFRSTRTSS
jgi:hypothetical protein